MPDKDHDRQFYISSDRESDCCLELFTITDNRFLISGTIYDCDTHEPLVGGIVRMVDSLNKETVNEVTLTASGQYLFKVKTKRPYNLVIKKKGYFTKVLPVPVQGKMGQDTL